MALCLKEQSVILKLVARYAVGEAAKALEDVVRHTQIQTSLFLFTHLIVEQIHEILPIMCLGLRQPSRSP